MAKVSRETLTILEGLINCAIIRTKPTESGDISYTNEPVNLVKIKTFMGKVRLVVANPSEPINGTAKTITLNPEFTDNNWIAYHYAKIGGDSPLNKWAGKKIKMVRPTKRGDATWMCKDKETPMLVHANDYHITLLVDDEYEIVLGPDYTNPDDWTLAE